MTDVLLPLTPALGIPMAVLLVGAAGVAAFARLERDDGRSHARPMLTAGPRPPAPHTLTARHDTARLPAPGTLAAHGSRLTPTA